MFLLSVYAVLYESDLQMMDAAILVLFISCLFPDVGVVGGLWSGGITHCRCWFVTLIKHHLLPGCTRNAGHLVILHEKTPAYYDG